MRDKTKSQRMKHFFKMGEDLCMLERPEVRRLKTEYPGKEE